MDIDRLKTLAGLHESKNNVKNEYGFTDAEMARMIKALKTNKSTLLRLIRDLGLQEMTTAATVKAIREYYGR